MENTTSALMPRPNLWKLNFSFDRDVEDHASDHLMHFCGEPQLGSPN